MNPFLVEFLTRGGCHLCDDARPVVQRAARLAGARVDEIDIDGDDRLVRDFGLRIPVVSVGEAVVAEGSIESVFALWRGLVARRISRWRR